MPLALYTRWIQDESLQKLDVVPVTTGAKVGEGFSRTVPSPKQKERQSPDGTSKRIAVPQGRAVLDPAVLIRLPCT